MHSKLNALAQYYSLYISYFEQYADLPLPFETIRTIVMCAQSPSCVLLFVTPRTIVCQAPLSMRILQARVLECVAMRSSRASFQPRSPALQMDSLPVEPQGKPKNTWSGQPFPSPGNLPHPGQSPGLPHCRRILHQVCRQGKLAHAYTVLFHDYGGVRFKII